MTRKDLNFFQRKTFNWILKKKAKDYKEKHYGDEKLTKVKEIG